MYPKIALVAAFAGPAIAVIDIRPERLRREVLPRQTDISADPCLNVLNTVYANVPTPPPKIVSYEMTAPHQTDPCSITWPADISADYSSYTSAVLSWVNANSASIQSALSVCSTLTDLSASIPVCTATPGDATASGSSSAKATEGGDSPGSETGTAAGSEATGARNSPSHVTPNAGTRETGMVAAAVVAAGFIGVAAYL